MSATQLPDIQDVPDITQDNLECFEEIRQVLVRRGLEKKFGLTLLHSHFHIEDDEVMFETNDPSDRTLLMRPVRLTELELVKYRQTQWRLDTGGVSMACSCFVDDNGNHTHLPRH